MWRTVFFRDFRKSPGVHFSSTSSCHTPVFLKLPEAIGGEKRPFGPFHLGRKKRSGMGCYASETRVFDQEQASANRRELKVLELLWQEKPEDAISSHSDSSPSERTKENRGNAHCGVEKAMPPPCPARPCGAPPIPFSPPEGWYSEIFGNGEPDGGGEACVMLFKILAQGMFAASGIKNPHERLSKLGQRRTPRRQGFLQKAFLADAQKSPLGTPDHLKIRRRKFHL